MIDYNKYICMSYACSIFVIFISTYLHAPSIIPMFVVYMGSTYFPLAFSCIELPLVSRGTDFPRTTMIFWTCSCHFISSMRFILSPRDFLYFSKRDYPRRKSFSYNRSRRLIYPTPMRPLDMEGCLSQFQILHLINNFSKQRLHKPTCRKFL
jgi:hypothetical protein